MDCCVNTAGDPSASVKNFMNFGSETPGRHWLIFIGGWVVLHSWLKYYMR